MPRKLRDMVRVCRSLRSVGRVHMPDSKVSSKGSRRRFFESQQPPIAVGGDDAGAAMALGSFEFAIGPVPIGPDDGDSEPQMEGVPAVGRRRSERRAIRVWGLIVAAILIGATATSGLVALDAAEQDARVARESLSRLQLESGRLHSWARRAVIGQSGAGELAGASDRMEAMAEEMARLRPLAAAEPTIAELVVALDEYRSVVQEEVRRVAGGDRSGAMLVQQQAEAGRFELLTAALAPAQAAASERAERAHTLHRAGSVATLLISLLSTGLLVWGVERTRRASEVRFRALVQNAVEVVAIVGTDGILRYASPPIQALLGYLPEDVIGSPLLAHVHHDDESAVRRIMGVAAAPSGTMLTESFRLRRRDGSLRHVEIVGQNLTQEPGIHGILLNARDVTERNALEAELAYRANHDSLTKLPNRALLVERLGLALARKPSLEHGPAVLFIDLDGFKRINDGLSHDAGDRLLVAVAGRLRACIRDGDTVSRFGGDEFVVLGDALAGEAEATAVAERCLEALREAFVLDGREVFVGASIGVALAGAEPMLPEELLRRADTAMYAAKAQGKNRYALFDQYMEARPLERLQLEADLRRAVERHELRLHYQPIVELNTGAIGGFEALLRWQQPDGMLVPPAQFIPLAEETGLIVPIGRWVLEQACRQARVWQARQSDTPALVMSVNLSGRQFREPALVDDVAAALRATGLPPECLVLEITESVALEADTTTTRTLQALKHLGVQLAIDDFGTGYSSQSYLKRFPVDTLKIDRSFVDGLGRDAQDSAIVRSVIAIANSLQLSVTAEGIETVEQLDELRALGCHRGQGYLFGRPAAAHNAGLLLDRAKLGQKRPAA
jgi:diguanylate cyclase (GGDEF)-like protein/PAS domain S-box-containing protein